VKAAKINVERLTAEDRRELELLLQALDLPKLARASKSEPSDLPYSRQLAEIIEASRKRHASMTPEELAADKAERERDEDELLEWRDGRGKNVNLSSPLLSEMVEAHCRLARWRHEQRNAAKADLDDEWRSMQRRRAEQANTPRPAVDYMRDTPRPQRVETYAPPERSAEPQPLAQAAEHADYVDLPLTERAAARLARKGETVLESLDGIDKRERAWREAHAIGGGWGT